MPAQSVANLKSAKLLFTNDDGCKSPLFKALLHEFASCFPAHNLRFAAPKKEQSWVSQAITRFTEIKVTPASINDLQGFEVAGTPADCASLGINNLYNNKPDFLISGINLGQNTGLPFYLFSGTIGAARTGFLSEVPSVAFSVDLPENLFAAWYANDDELIASHLHDWKRIAKETLRIFSKLVSLQFWTIADIFTVNLPWQVHAKSPVAVTKINRLHVDKMFEETSPLVFKHKFQGARKIEEYGILEDRKAGSLTSDLLALEESYISITPVSYNLSPMVPESFLEAFRNTQLIS